MLVSAADSEHKSKIENHFVPSNIVDKQKRSLKHPALCTVIVTFSNEENKDVTSAHVFTTTTPQLYPQTRKTVFQTGSQMSLTSTPFSTDDERYSVTSPKPLVQEVSISYSAPYTATKPKNSHQQPIADSSAAYLLQYDKNDDLHSHTYNYDSSRFLKRSSSPFSGVEKSDSVERLLHSGRLETEFPAKPSPTPTDEVPYFSAQSAIKKAAQTFSQSAIVSESTTFEELTTITTSNSRSTKKKEIKTEMPTVNLLTKQFEASARQEKTVPLRLKKTANTPDEVKSKSRVVVIDKSERQYSTNTSRPSVVYTPAGILTTTIVDIEPARTGRRIEEYKIQEEYIVKRYDNTPTPPPTQTQNQNQYQQSHQTTQQFRSTTPKRYSSNDNRENIETVDTSSIDIRNVIDQFETRIGEQSRSVSRIDMNDNNSRVSEKIIVHQRSETPLERVIPVVPIPDPIEEVQQVTTIVPEKDVVPPNVPELSEEALVQTQTYQEIKTISLNQTLVSPPIPSAPTPSPTLDAISPVPVQKSRLELENIEKKETTEKTEEITDKVESDEYLQHFIDRDYNIKQYEEWSTTSRRRDRSQPPERPSPTSYSSLSDRSRSIDRLYERRNYSRAYSEGRGLASGNYGGVFSGNLVSGMSSAGAICTTQIRDAREREKREIGLLNDRLADYIEKVRFLAAQNQCLTHDIDILKRGFGSGGHVAALFNSELAQAKLVLEQTISSRGAFDRDIASLTSEIEALKKQWQAAIATIKAHREDHDIDLDRLAKLEAEISLFKRKIRIVEEDVIRIRKENDGIIGEIQRIRQLTHVEIAAKNERSLNVQDLLQRIKLLETENSTRIQQELVFISKDTTSENREYFRRELQNAIRDIRADYEAISTRNRQEIEVWYREQIRKIQENAGRVNVDLYKEEIISIRSTLSNVKSRLAEIESRNYILEKQIADLASTQAEEAKFYEATLAEKDAAIAKLRDQCTELSLQMEKLCDNEITLRTEIERYRSLISGANVTTYTPNTNSSSTIRVGGVVRDVTTTTRTHSSSNTSYSNIPLSHSHAYTVGGNIGGISVGGTVGGHATDGHISVGGNIGGASVGHVSVGGNVGGGSVTGAVSPRPDRIHDEKGTDEFGRDFHSWYLGTISINKVTPDYIELKNICKIRRVDVGGFRIEQSVNGQVLGGGQVNVPLILDPQQVLRFYTINSNAQFATNLEKFDISTLARTSLYNYTEPNEERGWFVYLN